MNKEEVWGELKTKFLKANSDISAMITYDQNLIYNLGKREGIRVALSYMNELEACLDNDENFIYRNEAISRISDSSFTLGKAYQASQIFSNGTINLVDNEGQIVTVDIDDKDFLFNLNIKEKRQQK